MLESDSSFSVLLVKGSGVICQVTYFFVSLDTVMNVGNKTIDFIWSH